MPRFRKVYVNSSHRTQGSSTNFHFEFALDIDCSSPSGKCSCAVTSVSVPNAFFGIQANVNDKLYIYQKHPTTVSLGQNNIITLPAGNYTSSVLASAILTGLTAVALGSASYNVTYNPVTQRITITQTNGGGFLIYDDQSLRTLGRKDPLNGELYGTLPLIKNPQSLQQVLNIPVAFTDPQPSFTSGIITLARVTECMLRSPNMTNMSTMDAQGRQDVLKRILLDRPFGEVVTTDSNIESSDLFDVSGKTLRAVDFTLTDGHGNVLDLHGIDFSFALNFIFGETE